MKVPGGEIYGNLKSSGRPPAGMRAFKTLFNHPRCQDRNLSRRFGQGNKFVGKNKSQRGVKPSDQCFKTADLFGLQIYLWLEMNRQFILIKRRRELLKQGI